MKPDHWISRCPACGALSELPLPTLCGECGVAMVDAWLEAMILGWLSE